MSLAGLYFAKFGLLAAIYVFLGAVLAVIVRDLRHGPAPSKAPAAGLWLVREEGGGEPPALPLSGELLLGRAPVCSMRVEDPYASAYHASLVSEGEGARLTDLSSSNGTFLANGERLTGSVLLHPDERFSIGEAWFRLKKNAPPD